MSAVAAGGANLLGNIVSGLFQSSAQNSANNTNIQLARENREHTEYLSNTAYQRASTDMKAAGLNPIMSVSPASSPQGSSAQVEPTNAASGIGSGISSGISSGLAVASTAADVENKAAQTALNNAAVVTEGAKAQQATSSAKESLARTEQLRAELPAKAAKSRFDEAQADIDYKNRDYDNTMRRIQQGVGIGNSALDMINPLKKILPGSGNAKDDLYNQWKKYQRRQQ